ncbi:LysR family transcriptional regulator [Bordetella sp. N]|uniref:LysR family transcriptional regulator n=1 Tax=Bordetella sp. N TaxID=1746199 RepID=UPI00070B0868|nr:LysR family transcriptional regulator [Bordetella sp. N]ALM87180.1 LysR family transcriptional regulator [Bordetella sp. N]
MSLIRRFLPPTAELCAFEAAARRQSFTAAAEELNLTQSAVSRQIRSLEMLLGADLFIRERQTVRLTAAGHAFAQEVRGALQRIANATLGFRANPVGGTVNLAVLPTLGARWLLPRLPDFIAAHPDITVNLITRFEPFDFQAESLDAAIHYGADHWPGARVDFLMEEMVVPVCSPRLKARHGYATAADLATAPLLHLVSRPDAWERWFDAMDVPVAEVHGMLVDQIVFAAQAAIAGMGVAVLPKFLIEDELRRGDLVLAVDRPLRSQGNYYLAWPPGKQDSAPLQVFRQWLLAQANPAPVTSA